MIIKKRISKYGRNFETVNSSRLEFTDGNGGYTYYSIFDLVYDSGIITAICNPINESLNVGVVIKSADMGKTWTQVFVTSARFTTPILGGGVIVQNKLLQLYISTMSSQWTPSYVYPFTDTPVVTHLVYGPMALANGKILLGHTGPGIQGGIYWIWNIGNNVTRSDTALSSTDGTYISTIRSWYLIDSRNTLINDTSNNIFHISSVSAPRSPLVITKLSYTGHISQFRSTASYIFGFDNAHGSSTRGQHLYKFSNDFSTCTDIIANIPRDNSIDDVERFAVDSGNLYVTVNRYDENTGFYTGIIYRSSDDGETWQVVREGYRVYKHDNFNDGYCVNRLSFIDNFMYLFKGSFDPDVSFDNGETWQETVCWYATNHEEYYSIYNISKIANKNLLVYGNGGVYGFDSYRTAYSLDTVDEVKYTKYLDEKGTQELVTQAKNYVDSLVQ